MDIHIDEFMDYITCPLKHKLRYKDKIDVTFTNLHAAYPKHNPYSLEEAFDKEMHKLFYHVFNYIQDGRYPSEYLLRQKWGKLWAADKTVSDILFDATRKDAMSERTRLEKLGIKAIEKMHPKFKQDPGLPILIGKITKVTIGRHTLTVPIELIREVKGEDGKPFFELVDFQTGIMSKINQNAQPLKLHIHHDMRTTAASYAFRKLTGAEEGLITYYDVINDKEFATSRGENDYKTLETMLDHVEAAMNAGVFYPVMNDRCFECPFQHHCRRRDWYDGKRRRT